MTQVCSTLALIASLTLWIPAAASAQHDGHQPQAPAPVRQITGPAEAALQAFQDALQVGNRDLATQWLAPEVTVVEGSATDSSRDAYARGRMRGDMEFLKASKVTLLDRQLRKTPEGWQIVRLEWSSEPADDSKMPAGAAATTI